MSQVGQRSRRPNEVLNAPPMVANDVPVALERHHPVPAGSAIMAISSKIDILLWFLFLQFSYYYGLGPGRMKVGTLFQEV